MRSVILLCLMLTMTGCSALKALDYVMPQAGVEVDANVSKGGCREDSVVQNGNTNVSVDAGKESQYQGPIDTVINEGELPLHVLLLLVLLAGWAIPSPEEMGHGLVRLIRALRGASQ